MKALVVFLFITVSCKAHVRETDTSEPDFAQSDDGTMLLVSLAKKPNPSASDPKPSHKPRYCVTRISQKGFPRVELLTNGGLDDMQLKSALRFMGLPSHLISGALLIIGGVASMVIAEKKGIATVGTPIGMAIVGVTVAGAIAYRIIKGNKEGEGKAAITVQSLMAGPIVTAPLTEAIHRSYRFNLITSDEQVLKLSDKKMKKVIERIKSKKPKYKDNCPVAVTVVL